MDLKNKKPEDFMYDSSDAEWSDESTSDYWKRVEENVIKKLGLSPRMAMDGRWITIGHRDANPEEDDEGRKGRHIYLDDGEIPEEAIEELKEGKEEKGKTPEKKEKTEEKQKVDTEEKQKVDTKEKPKEMADMSDEEITNKKKELYEKSREQQFDEDAYVNADEQMKKHKEEYDRLRRESWFASGEKLSNLDKEMENVKAKMNDIEYQLREKYRKEHGDWHETFNEYRKFVDEYRARENKRAEEFDKRVDEIGAGINEKNVMEKFDEAVKLEKEIDSLGAFDKFSRQKEINEKINKPIVDVLSQSMLKKIGRYKETTNKFVEGLADYNKEYNEAVQELKTIKEKEDFAFEKWAHESDGELKQKYKGELDAVRLKKYETMDKRRTAEKKSAENVAQLFKNTFGDTGSKIEVKKSKKGSAGADFYDRVSLLLDGVVGKNISTKDAPTIKKTTSLRSYFNESKGIAISTYDKDDGTKIHEYCHFLEHKNPRMLLNSKAFLKYRTQGEALISMNKAENTNGYGSHEKTRPDKFFKSYCGKVYSTNGEYYSADATEIMSMGLERIFENPVAFAQEDREYFDFVIANIRGDI